MESGQVLERGAQELVHGGTTGLVYLALRGDTCYCWSRAAACGQPGVSALIVARGRINPCRR